MAFKYLRSADGSDSDTGATWPLARATLHNVTLAAGDVLNVSQVHAQSSAVTDFSANWGGTVANMNHIICANDAAEPPTAATTGASITSTGTGTIAVCTKPVYQYGMTYIIGNGAAQVIAQISGTKTIWDLCSLQIGSSASNSRFDVNSGNCKLVNTGIKFGAAGQSFFPRGITEIQGGSLLSGGTSPTNFFTLTAGHVAVLDVTGFDFSNASAGMNLVAAAAGSSLKARFAYCKAPASWSGAPYSGTLDGDSVIELVNFDAGAVNYAYWRETAYGSVRHETTLVRTGGSSDGTTPLSWKMVSNANAKHPGSLLFSQEIVKQNTVTGSAQTATVEILHDSATNLKDDEAWLELIHLSSSGAPLGTLVTDAKANVLGSNADQATSSATWTTTGMSNPNKQKLSASFTAQMAGIVIARVVLAKPSKTMYVDRKLAIA